MQIKLILEIEEVNAVLAALGKLPTESGVYPLAMKVKAQAEVQVPKDTQPEAA